MIKILDVVERMIRMDRLIKDGRTGSAKNMANELGIFRSHLFNHFEELKDLGIEISYNRDSDAFEYYGDMELKIQKPLQVIRKKKYLNDTNWEADSHATGGKYVLMIACGVGAYNSNM
ncbi:MAG: hypothetical protein JKX79_01095 [Labilibaculum sp.]|nr:hypothetical protein [Labilibaculum sp.]